jgi:hypothetical protein
MTTQEERIDQLFSEFVMASNAVLLKSLDRTPSYTEIVDDYRRIEAAFVARMGENEPGVLEIKRRIAESILWLAHEYNPSFDVCRDAWNYLVSLGFTDLNTRCMESSIYADCCAYDEQPEEGLAVLEPLLAQLRREIEAVRATQQTTEFYDDEIEKLGDLRDELLAQQRGEQNPGRRTRRTDAQREGGIRPGDG